MRELVAQVVGDPVIDPARLARHVDVAGVGSGLEILAQHREPQRLRLRSLPDAASSGAKLVDGDPVDVNGDGPDLSGPRPDVCGVRGGGTQRQPRNEPRDSKPLHLPKDPMLDRRQATFGNVC